MRVLAALLLLFAAAPVAAPAEAPVEAPVEQARVIREFPHDAGAFTEGLFFQDGALWESTGQVGQSSVRKVDLETGKVIRQVDIPPPYFGEGIASWKGQIISLTWQHGRGFRWSMKDFRPRGTFSYDGEGWSLTCDGTRLIMSDGTSVLRLLDPKSLKVVGRLSVMAEGMPLARLNELEYVNGEILANIWQTRFIARIDPRSGQVVGWIDVGALAQLARASGTDPVPNGIAWDGVGKRLFVTGKNWPVLFQIAPPGQP